MPRIGQEIRQDRGGGLTAFEFSRPERRRPNFNQQKGRMEMARKVWFITGASKGFGMELTKAALGAGGTVVASARNPKD
jgi:hypothetical protein